tara:strand:- start:555 stop:1649 length:1095 start_codon:yes stop_codon:yes gene_type:complete
MINDLKRVHIEASGRCNARCPMCSRHTYMGYIQPELVQSDLSSKIFYKFFTEDRTKNLDRVYFSGVYGDPCLNKNLPEFVKWFQTHRVDLSIDTNAGYRSRSWWEKLGNMKTRIHFAIDGLEDTNHIYRRNVVWKKVWENINVFQKAGGNGQWNFLVFKHNEHQVEEAKRIANSIGMDFRIKVTQKFRGHKNFSVMEDGKKLYDLFPSDIPEYRHPNIGDKLHLPKEEQARWEGGGPGHSHYFRKDGPYGTLGLTGSTGFGKLDSIKINCIVKEQQEVFLAFTGHLLPCCYIGTPHYDSPGNGQFLENIGISKFDLNKLSVEEAMNNLKLIEETWNRKNIQEGKLLTCAKTCGENMQNRTSYVE